MKTFKRLLRVALAAMLGASTLGISAAASATPVKPSGCFAGATGTMVAERQANRSKTISSAIANMLMKKESSVQIAKDLKTDYGVTMIGGGVHKVKKVVAPNVTDGNSVVLDDPELLTDCTGQFYAYGSFHFTYSGFTAILNDEDGSCNDCAVGGYDVFGFDFDNSVVITGSPTMYTWGNNSPPLTYPMTSSRTWVYKRNSAGIAFEGQDKAKDSTSEYSFANGEAFVDLSGCNGHSSLHVYTHYGHDWSSTNVSSISIGYQTFDITFSSGTHSWQKDSDLSVDGC